MNRLEEKELRALQTIAKYDCTSWDNCDSCPLALKKGQHPGLGEFVCLSGLASSVLLREVDPNGEL